MESRFWRLFLSLAILLGVSPVISHAEEGYAGGVIQPQIERREVTEADIDTENFEVGIYSGVMSVEDFGTNSVQGGHITYHFVEWGFLEAAYGETTLGLSSYERLSGAAPLMDDELRNMEHYYLALGFNILPGEAFVLGSRAHNNALYVMGGAGSSEFAGDKRSTIVYGIGYRLLVNDWIGMHWDMRGHIFDTDLLGEAKSLHNLETRLGLSVFF